MKSITLRSWVSSSKQLLSTHQLWEFSTPRDFSTIACPQRQDQCLPCGASLLSCFVTQSCGPQPFHTGDRFCGRQFFHRPRGGGWFQDDSRVFHLLCTLFLLLLHQLHLWWPGIRSALYSENVGENHSSTICGWLALGLMAFVKASITCKMRTVQFSSITQSCLTHWASKDYSTPHLPVHHQLPEHTQTHLHQVSDAIKPSHPLSSPSPPAFNLSLHQGLFQGVSSLHQVAKVLAFQLQHQSFQWMFRTDFLYGISLQSKGLSRVFSNTTVQKHQFFGTQLSVQSNSHIHTTTGKNIALINGPLLAK